jgi:RNA recognition motif-containing protein
MRTPVFKGNIIVSNLPEQATPTDLADLFERFGLVLGAKIDRWHDRPGGAQGMVDLAPDSAVEEAIRALNGHNVGPNRISVRRAPKQTKSSGNSPARRVPPPAPRIMPTEQPAPRPAYVAAPQRPVPTPMPSYTDHTASPPGSGGFHGGSSGTATMRKVIVEYRPPSRRVVLPPRRTTRSDGSA